MIFLIILVEKVTYVSDITNLLSLPRPPSIQHPHLTAYLLDHQGRAIISIKGVLDT